MSAHDNSLPNPSYLPEGFAHRLDAFGGDTAAFGFDPQQVVRIFTRDQRVDSWNRPLLVAWVPRPDAVLSATEDHPGMPIAVGSVNGFYHDGLWQLGDGPEQVDAGGNAIYWDRSDLHSITFAAEGGTLAVRASRLSGVELGDLERVGASI